MGFDDYVRAVTDGQSVDAQVKQLRAGVEKVLRETASGAMIDRATFRLRRDGGS